MIFLRPTVGFFIITVNKESSFSSYSLYTVTLLIRHYIISAVDTASLINSGISLVWIYSKYRITLKSGTLAVIVTCPINVICKTTVGRHLQRLVVPKPFPLQ